jgi:plastocyanin
VWDASVPLQLARCMKIKAGQSVEFAGDFIEHPLSAFGGDTPNPIFSQASVLFPEPGLFGYLCTIHGSMTGAIWVVP